MLTVNNVWKPICRYELTTPFGSGSQPTLEDPSTAYLQSFEALLLEDCPMQLPPYFCDATLNGLQVVDTEKKNETTNIQFIQVSFSELTSNHSGVSRGRVEGVAPSPPPFPLKSPKCRKCTTSVNVLFRDPYFQTFHVYSSFPDTPRFSKIPDLPLNFVR